MEFEARFPCLDGSLGHPDKQRFPCPKSNFGIFRRAVRTQDVSVWTSAVQTLLVTVWMLNFQYFLLSFQLRQFRPKSIFE
jgi:hypothetical protein